MYHETFWYGWPSHCRSCSVVRVLDMSVVLTELFWSLRFARLGAIGCWTRPRGWPAAHDACY